MIRRDLFKIIAMAMMPGGNPPQRPDQVVIPQTAAVAPGGAAGIFRGKLVIVSAGNVFSGVFVYNPSPGLGNLKESTSSVNGTDPYGNAYLAGFVTYSNPNIPGITWMAIQYTVAGMQAYSATSAAGPWSSNDSNGNLMPGFAIGEGSHGAELDWNDSVFSVGLITPAAPLTSQDPGSATTKAETWHTMPAMSASWTVGGFAKYRLTAQGDLQVAWQDLVPGSDADNTTIWAAASLPAAYRPAANHRVVCYTDILRQPSAGIFSGASLGINTDGSVVCFGIAAAATRVDLYATIPISA